MNYDQYQNQQYQQGAQQTQYQAPPQGYQAPQQNYQTQAGQPPVDEDDLDMNATIQDDGNDFVLLPEGVYDFIVTDFEPGEYQEKPQGPNIPGKTRKKIVVSIQVEYEGQKQTIKDSIPLLRKMEWKFCQLFKAIGDRKKGESLVMDWNNIRGKGGKCKIKVDTFKNRTSGENMQSNKIAKYFDPAESTNQAPAGYAAPDQNTQMQAPTFQNPAQTQQPQQTQQAPQVQGNIPQPTGAASSAGWNSGGFK
jgi:hypothetical protein